MVMGIVRRFRKNLSLRMVNLAGLSVVFACLLLSVAYIKRELSYDRRHTNFDRIVRLQQIRWMQSRANKLEKHIINPCVQMIICISFFWSFHRQ